MDLQLLRGNQLAFDMDAFNGLNGQIVKLSVYDHKAVSAEPDLFPEFFCAQKLFL